MFRTKEKFVFKHTSWFVFLYFSIIVKKNYKKLHIYYSVPTENVGNADTNYYSIDATGKWLQIK